MLLEHAVEIARTLRVEFASRFAIELARSIGVEAEVFFRTVEGTIERVFEIEARREIGIVEWDEKFSLVKLNPLAAWDERQVWTYIMTNGVPYNELHDKNYPSIGCTYCTKPVKAGEDPRSGRWSGFDKTECGIQEGSVTILENEGKI